MPPLPPSLSHSYTHVCNMLNLYICASIMVSIRARGDDAALYPIDSFIHDTGASDGSFATRHLCYRERNKQKAKDVIIVSP